MKLKLILIFMLLGISRVTFGAGVSDIEIDPLTDKVYKALGWDVAAKRKLPADLDILGFAEGAGPNKGEIKRKYIAILKHWNPDNFADEEDKKFANEVRKIVNPAYERLSKGTAGPTEVPLTIPELNKAADDVITGLGGYSSKTGLAFFDMQLDSNSTDLESRRIAFLNRLEMTHHPTAVLNKVRSKINTEYTVAQDEIASLAKKKKVEPKTEAQLYVDIGLPRAAVNQHGLGFFMIDDKETDVGKVDAKIDFLVRRYTKSINDFGIENLKAQGYSEEIVNKVISRINNESKAAKTEIRKATGTVEEPKPIEPQKTEAQLYMELGLPDHSHALDFFRLPKTATEADLASKRQAIINHIDARGGDKWLKDLGYSEKIIKDVISRMNDEYKAAQEQIAKKPSGTEDQLYDQLYKGLGIPKVKHGLAFFRFENDPNPTEEKLKTSRRIIMRHIERRGPPPALISNDYSEKMIQDLISRIDKEYNTALDEIAKKPAKTEAQLFMEVGLTGDKRGLEFFRLPQTATLQDLIQTRGKIIDRINIGDQKWLIDLGYSEAVIRNVLSRITKEFGDAQKDIASRPPEPKPAEPKKADEPAARKVRRRIIEFNIDSVNKLIKKLDNPLRPADKKTIFEEIFKAMTSVQTAKDYYQGLKSQFGEDKSIEQAIAHAEKDINMLSSSPALKELNSVYSRIVGLPALKEENKLESAKSFLEWLKAGVNAPVDKIGQPLLSYALYSNLPDEALILIDYGASKDVPPAKNGRTPAFFLEKKPGAGDSYYITNPTKRAEIAKRLGIDIKSDVDDPIKKTRKDTINKYAEDFNNALLAFPAGDKKTSLELLRNALKAADTAIRYMNLRDIDLSGDKELNQKIQLIKDRIAKLSESKLYDELKSIYNTIVTLPTLKEENKIDTAKSFEKWLTSGINTPIDTLGQPLLSYALYNDLPREALNLIDYGASNNVPPASNGRTPAWFITGAGNRITNPALRTEIAKKLGIVL